MYGASQIHVEIIEEPENEIKFRYETEGRLSSRITGVNSTERRKTYPTIKIHGYQGDACVVASLVTVEPPYYPHPHKLAGKSCVNGVFYKTINNVDMTCCFTDLRFQGVKRRDIQESLALREALQVDPYGTGFSHASEPGKINYNAVRLCFQVLLPDSTGKFCIPVARAISKPISNIAVSDLRIIKLSHCSAPVSGGLDVILLCGQVKKNDVEIVFYEENEQGQRTWEDTGKFYPDDVHRQVAISFKTPPYENPNIQQKIKCFICLRRPSDEVEGKAIEFILFPPKEDINSEVLVHKQRIFKELDVNNIFQLSCLSPQNSSAVSQSEANLVPGNRFVSLASASVSKGVTNYGNALSSYFEIPLSTTNAQSAAISPFVHQNFDEIRIDGQIQGYIRLVEDKDAKTTSFDSLEKILTSGRDVNPNDLVEFFSGMSIDCTFEAAIDVNNGKTENEQMLSQDSKRKNGNNEDLVTSTDAKLNNSDLLFNSNSLSGNLNGMSIDSITESALLIAAGLLNNDRICNEQMPFEDNGISKML